MQLCLYLWTPLEKYVYLLIVSESSLHRKICFEPSCPQYRNMVEINWIIIGIIGHGQIFEVSLAFHVTVYLVIGWMRNKRAMEYETDCAAVPGPEHAQSSHTLELGDPNETCKKAKEKFYHLRLWLQNLAERRQAQGGLHISKWRGGGSDIFWVCKTLSSIPLGTRFGA